MWALLTREEDTKLKQNKEKESKRKYMSPAEHHSLLHFVQVLCIACPFSFNTVSLTLILSHFQCYLKPVFLLCTNKLESTVILIFYYKQI